MTPRPSSATPTASAQVRRSGRGDFSGGDKTVAHRLEALGFTVRYLPYPDWTRDEIILACELVEANGWKQLDARIQRVKALSELLQSPAIHPLEPRHPDFRNPAGVARKTQNIATVHPAYRGAPSNGNQLDKQVLDDFLADPAGMHAMAARIRELLTGGEANATAMPDLDTDDPGTGKAASLSVPTSAANATRSSAAGRSRTPNGAASRSPAKCAPSTSATRTAPMDSTTSNATTAPRCTSPGKPRPGWPTWPCSARTVTG